MTEPLAPYRVMPPDPRLLGQPLELLRADLFRLRLACLLLDMLAEDPLRDPPLLARGLAEYFRVDWLLHLDDLERRLFPLMQGSLLVGDWVDLAIRQLVVEHSRDRAEAASLLRSLEQVADGDTGFDDERFALRAGSFSEAQRRHVAWIESVILPSAHDRLRPEGLGLLRTQLAAARGWSPAQDVLPVT